MYFTGGSIRGAHKYRFEVATPSHPPRATSTPLNTPCDGIPVSTKPSHMATFARILHSQTQGKRENRYHDLIRGSAPRHATSKFGNESRNAGALSSAVSGSRDTDSKDDLFSSPARSTHPTSHYSAPDSVASFSPHVPRKPSIVRRASDVSDIQFSTPWKNYTLAKGVCGEGLCCFDLMHYQMSHPALHEREQYYRVLRGIDRVLSADERLSLQCIL